MSHPACDFEQDSAAALAIGAKAVLVKADQRGYRLVSAESCTGGLVSSLLTDIEGYSSAFERGFATYTDEAKIEVLGVDPGMIASHGVVSKEVAIAMAIGALQRSHGDLAVSITGYAGPGDGVVEEGLVHLAVSTRHGATVHRECHFGKKGRDPIRHLAAKHAFEMLEEALDRPVDADSAD